MTTSGPRTADEDIAAVPADRREAVQRVRDVIRENLPAGHEEDIQFG